MTPSDIVNIENTILHQTQDLKSTKENKYARREKKLAFQSRCVHYSSINYSIMDNFTTIKNGKHELNQIKKVKKHVPDFKKN